MVKGSNCNLENMSVLVKLKVSSKDVRSWPMSASLASRHSYVVAVVCPVPATLAEIAAKFGKQDLSFEDMVLDKDVCGAVLREVQSHAKKSRLEKFEIPGALTLTPIEWTPESGLVTAAMKLKRKPLQDHYDQDIKRMYGMT